MKVKVKFFAAPREAIGRSEVEQELPAGATVRELLDEIIAQYPVLCRHVETMNMAVNRRYVDWDAVLQDGDTVACVPPVGGG
jgi:molybdopterin synthase sulfur carrier subunit